MSDIQVLGGIMQQLDDLMMGVPAKKCEHKNKIYQPAEKDTNTPEDYYCENCGKQLPIPDGYDV
jgi:hypothetical protein|tara:strand:- start:1996 stop:2187 length:192 start_codon:yes stop_codon:yes gene_type:complete